MKNLIFLAVVFGLCLLVSVEAQNVGGSISQPYASTSANNNFTAPQTINVDSGATAGISIGTGSNTGNFAAFSGGRAMLGYDSGAGFAVGAGVGKSIEFFVNGTNGTFLSGTHAMNITSGGTLQLPLIPSTTGTRYVCIDSSGNVTSSASACSGT